MKIIIGEFMQETNAFCPAKTVYDDFYRAGILRGNDVFLQNVDQPNALGGMIRAVQEADGEAIYSVAMHAQSGGLVEHEIINGFIRELLKTIEDNQPIDGVFLSCHGATQSTQADDGVGYILSAVRNTVGDTPVIAISTDLHANVTEQMINTADVICGYHTYPHVDLFETGYRAASLGIQCIQKSSVRPVMAWCSAPMIVPASVYNTNEGPFSELIHEAEKKQKEGEYLDFSIYQMQPWMDVEKGGSAVLIISDDTDKAVYYARELAQKLYDMRKVFQARLHTVEDIVAHAQKAPRDHPVILADSADSSNAGAAGDSPFVIRKLLELGSPVKAALLINDAPAVRQAMKLGIGAEAEFTLGGTVDSMHEPLKLVAKVRSLHDGDFLKEGPAGRGIDRHCGPTAVLRAGNIDIVVTTAMTGNGDPQLFRNFGVEPTFYQLVAVKACTSFRAAYSQFASDIFEADTPGAAAVNISLLPFHRLPRPFYPLDDPDWKADDVRLAHRTSI